MPSKTKDAKKIRKIHIRFCLISKNLEKFSKIYLQFPLILQVSGMEQQTVDSKYSPHNTSVDQSEFGLSCKKSGGLDQKVYEQIKFKSSGQQQKQHQKNNATVSGVKTYATTANGCKVFQKVGKKFKNLESRNM